MKDWLATRRIELTAAAIIILLFTAPVIALLWATSVPGTSFAGPLPPLSESQRRIADALRKDVETIAARPHNVAHPRALEEAARHVENRLTSMGYTVRQQAFETDGAIVRNIEAVLAPNTPSAQTLVIGAHYDSYGNVRGANDNASGTAAVLELARLLRDRAGHSAIRVRFVLFTNEEPPYFQKENMGSLLYARRLAASEETVLGMMSLETMGSYSDARDSQHYPFPLSLLYPDTGNFIAFVGMTSSRPFLRKTVGTFREVAAFPSVGGTAPAIVQGIDWSDHWSFAQQGIPALMVTDTAPFRYRHYHGSADTPDKIDYDRLAGVVSGLEAMIRRWSIEGMGARPTNPTKVPTD